MLQKWNSILRRCSVNKVEVPYSILQNRPLDVSLNYYYKLVLRKGTETMYFFKGVLKEVKMDIEMQTYNNIFCVSMNQLEKLREK